MKRILQSDSANKPVLMSQYGEGAIIAGKRSMSFGIIAPAEYQLEVRWRNQTEPKPEMPEEWLSFKSNPVPADKNAGIFVGLL